MRYLIRYREWLLLPLFVVLMVAMAKLVWLVSGRAPIDDPGEIVSGCYRAIRLALAIGMTGYVQDHHFGYRSKGGDAPLRDDLYDACATLSLLSLFVWALWH